MRHQRPRTSSELRRRQRAAERPLEDDDLGEKTQRTAWRIAHGMPTMLTNEQEHDPRRARARPGGVFQRGEQRPIRASNGARPRRPASAAHASAIAASIAATYAINVTTHPMSAPRGTGDADASAAELRDGRYPEQPRLRRGAQRGQGHEDNPTAVRRTMLRQ